MQDAVSNDSNHSERCRKEGWWAWVREHTESICAMPAPTSKRLPCTVSWTLGPSIIVHFRNNETGTHTTQQQAGASRSELGSFPLQGPLVKQLS